MSYMSTSSLREMLDEAAPGPWSAVHDGGADDTARILAKRTHLGKRTYIGISHGADADLTALAPELAEEVIRLREENARLQELERLCKTSEEFFAGLDKE